MKKIKLLLVAFAAMCGLNGFAVTFDTDLTKQFASLTQASNWTTGAGGKAGFTATNFCPMVEVNGLGKRQVCEFYEGNCNRTGDLLYQTVSGLTKGTYRIELYGAAAFTFDRGFTSTAFQGTSWKPGDKIEEETGVYLYAETSNGTLEMELPIYYAQEFPEGASTATLEGVKVGDDGQVRIGMRKETTSTNWHVIQLKSVIATVDGDALMNATMERYNEVAGQEMAPSVANNLETKLAAAQQNLTQATWEAFDAAVTLAEKSVKSYQIIADGFIPTDDLDGWTCTNGQDFHINTWSTEGGPNQAGDTRPSYDPSGMTTPFIENWIGKGNFLGEGVFSYTLEGLEPGEVYYAEALIRAYNEASSAAPNGPDFFINDKEDDLTAKGITFTYSGMSGIYATLGATAKVGADGKITIGARVAAGANYNWVAFKNVIIKSQDEVLAEKQDMLNDLFAIYEMSDAVKNQVNDAIEASYNPTDFDAVMEQINAAADAAKASNDVMMRLNAAIDAAGQRSSAISSIDMDGNGESDYELYNAAALIDEVLNDYYGSIPTDAYALDGIDRLNQAVKASEGLEAALGRFELTKEKAELTIENVGDSDNALTYAISECVAQVNECENVEEIDAVCGQLWNAIADQVATITVTEGNPFDLTFLLTNPDVTEYWDGNTWGVQPEGWYNEQDGGNFQVMANEEMGPGGEVFFEYWSGTAASNGFVLCQKVVLPSGAYQMTGRVGAQQYDGNGTTTDITFSANDVDGTQIAFGPLQDGQLDFVQVQTGEVSIGLKAHAGNNTRWMAINDIHLYKVAPKPIVIDEMVAYTPASAAGNVTLKRAFTGQWETFVVPFQIKEDELKDAFGSDVAVAEFQEEVEMEDVEVETGTDPDTGDPVYGNQPQPTGNSTISFKPMDNPAVAPNKPVVIKVSSKATSFVFENRTIAAGEPVVKGVNFDFVGTYTPATTVPDYYIVASNEGVAFKLADGTKINGTRAYIQGTGIILNDVATAIRQLEGEAATSGAIFNLAGQQVSKAQKGIYIVDGKKVLVK